VLSIAHAPEAYLDTARNVAAIQTTLQVLTGQSASVRFVVAESLAAAVAPAGAGAAGSLNGGSNPGPRPTATAAVRPTDPKSAEPRPKPAAPVLLDKEEFRNDPLIRQALEVFKGRILEVRAPSDTP
jgi:hypothetical protein